MLCKYNHSVLHLVSRSLHAVLHTSKLQKCWTLRFIDGFIGLRDFLSCADGGRVCPVQVVRECALDSLWEAAENQRPEPGHSEAAMRKVERCRAMLHHITLCTILASKIRSGFQPSCKCEYQAVSRWGNPIASFGLIIIEGSLEVKLLTIWTDEKQRWEESEKRRRRKKNQRRERVRRKKIQEVGNSRNTVFFQ